MLYLPHSKAWLLYAAWGFAAASIRTVPVKNEIKPIPAPAEKIAKAIFFAADKKIPKPMKKGG